MDNYSGLGLSEPSEKVRALVTAIRSAPTMNTVGVEASRQSAGNRQTTPKREEVHSITEHTISSGDTPFDVRCYRASPADLQPVVVYFHAGGWILGDLEHSDHLCRRMANQMGAAVVNVDYRLAPESVFPAAFDDCVAATLWAREHALSIGGDPTCIALAGESSGGGLAAAVALELSNKADTAPNFLLLLEPALDIRTTSNSWQTLGALFAPVREQMDWMWSLYAPDKSMRSDPRVSPSVAKTIPEWHPATLIVAAEYDPLKDEAMAYAEKLTAQGIAVTARIEPGLPHAFCNLGGFLPQGLQAFDHAIAEMNTRLRQDQDV